MDDNAESVSSRAMFRAPRRGFRSNRGRNGNSWGENGNDPPARDSECSGSHESGRLESFALLFDHFPHLLQRGSQAFNTRPGRAWIGYHDNVQAGQICLIMTK